MDHKLITKLIILVMVFTGISFFIGYKVAWNRCYKLSKQKPEYHGNYGYLYTEDCELMGYLDSKGEFLLFIESKVFTNPEATASKN